MNQEEINELELVMKNFEGQTRNQEAETRSAEVETTINAEVETTRTSNDRASHFSCTNHT